MSWALCRTLGAGLTPVLSLPRQFQCRGEVDGEQQSQSAVLRTLTGLGVTGAAGVLPGGGIHACDGRGEGGVGGQEGFFAEEAA